MFWLHNYYFVVLLMALAVYVCRAGGYWLAGKVHLGNGVRGWLSYLPGCILISIVAPLLKGASLIIWVGATVTALMMVFLDNLLIAMCSGIAVVLLLRFMFGIL